MSGEESSGPLASLSIDLDDRWSYLKVRGSPEWESLPTFLPTLIPRALGFLAEHSLRITFFVVGQDAALERNRSLLRAVADAGHEVANHSFHHDSWLHLYSEARLRREIEMAEEAIEKATGHRPRGFRGPGFSTTCACRRLLASRGYVYDASPCANILGPLARLYYLHNVPLTEQQREERKRLNASLRAALGRNRASIRAVDGTSLVEVPVTTMPFFRLPIHLSYLQALAARSEAAAAAYFQLAQTLCRITGNTLSLLLHPTDFLGSDDECGLPFFPAMGLPSARKLAFVHRVVRMVASAARIVPVLDHAMAVRKASAPLAPA